MPDQPGAHNRRAATQQSSPTVQTKTAEPSRVPGGPLGHLSLRAVTGALEQHSCGRSSKARVPASNGQGTSKRQGAQASWGAGAACRRKVAATARFSRESRGQGPSAHQHCSGTHSAFGTEACVEAHMHVWAVHAWVRKQQTPSQCGHEPAMGEWDYLFF